MRFRARDIAGAVVDEVLTHPRTDHSALIDAALELLRRFRLFRQIRIFPRLVLTMLHGREGTLPAQLTTPSGSSGKAREGITDALERVLQKRVELAERPDAGLLGGAVIAVGDERIDASVRGALNHLASHLRTPALTLHS